MLVLLTLPTASAIDPHCTPQNVDAHVVHVEQEWWCVVHVTVRQCDVRWFGGRGLLGGFF